MSDSLRLPCPTCSGTGTDTHEDRHTETNRDTCRSCGGVGTIPARTGETPEASFRVTPPEGEGAGLREALADKALRKEVRDCIGETIPLRRRWVSALMAGPIARLIAERDAAALRNAEEFASRSQAPGDPWDMVRHLEEQCLTVVRERDEWKSVADRELGLLRAAEADNTRLKAGMEALGAALKPFASEAERYDPEEGDDSDHLYGDVRLRIGDLRAARHALATLSQEQPHG